MLLNLDQREYAKLNDKAYALEKDVCKLSFLNFKKMLLEINEEYVLFLREEIQREELNN